MIFESLVVEKLIPGGEGLCRRSGLTVFVPGVLPGEVVNAAVTERKKGWARTGQAEILTASPDRVQPFCPLYGECGGCSWQHIEYSAQMKARVSFSREALMRQGKLTDDEIPPFRVVSSPPRAFRSRIRPGLTADGIPGFRAAASNRIVPVSDCPVLRNGLNRFLAAPGELTRPSAVFGDDDDFWVEHRDPLACASVAGKTFRFPPGSFFQSNLYPLPELIDFVLKAAGSGETALDLYGGAGLFGAFLADSFQTVIGVEQDSRSCWKDNVGSRGIFFPVAVEKWRAGEHRPDFAVADPPRSGLSGAACRLVSKIPRIAYVSCNPVTQARDICLLRQAGFTLERYGVFDLYPQTPHVETVAVLSRRDDAA